jgi:hypothetical protein
LTEEGVAFINSGFVPDLRTGVLQIINPEIKYRQVTFKRKL